MAQHDHGRRTTRKFRRLYTNLHMAFFGFRGSAFVPLHLMVRRSPRVVPVGSTTVIYTCVPPSPGSTRRQFDDPALRIPAVTPQQRGPRPLGRPETTRRDGRDTIYARSSRWISTSPAISCCRSFFLCTHCLEYPDACNSGLPARILGFISVTHWMVSAIHNTLGRCSRITCGD